MAQKEVIKINKINNKTNYHSLKLISSNKNRLIINLRQTKIYKSSKNVKNMHISKTLIHCFIQTNINSNQKIVNYL